MNFLFIAPFRTNLNLNSLEAVGDRKTIVDILLQAAESENEGTSDFQWKTAWSKEENGELHYSELNEDFIPDSATPILNLHIQPKHLKKELEKKIPENESIEYEINRCNAIYYDNTVGILTLEVSISDIYRHEDIFPRIDKWSTNTCSSTIEIITPFEDSAIAKIHKISNKKDKFLFLQPNSFIVFFDRPDHTTTNPCINAERMLWVNRTYMSPNNKEAPKTLEIWTQSTNLMKDAIILEESAISACVGNSVIHGPLSENNKYAFETALQISTYFYVLYDVFNKILRLLYLDLSNRKKTKETTISRANRIRAHIEFIENEFSDVLIGLQGGRSAIANKFMETWKYNDLVNSVQKKKNSVSALTDSMLSEQQNKYGRVVEAFLAAIGGVSLLDFILNLFSFSNDKNLNNDNVLGIVDGAKHLPTDGALYAAITLLAFTLTLVLRKR